MNPVVHFEIGGTDIAKSAAFAWLSDLTGTTIGLWQAA
jgi:hypothetical protein